MEIFKFIEGNTELLYQDVSDKKVLVLGSGPSAGEVDWESYEWDVLITTSFFYLNDLVISKKPIHITLSDIVDLTDTRLLDYLDSNQRCTIAFEPKIHPFYESIEFKNFISKYKSRIIFYNIFPEFGGKEGVAGRVCWIVLACEPSHLMICGIDGVSKNRELDPINYFRKHIGTTDNYTYDDYLKSFQFFGELLYNTANDMGIPIKNLGKGKEYNMISKISEKFEK